MIKYLNLLKYEFKTILRDPVNLYMCIFPLIILALSSYVFPVILKSVESGQETAQRSPCLAFVYRSGLQWFPLQPWLPSFSWNIRMNPHFTPSPSPQCRLPAISDFKMAYLYFMSVISGIVVLWGTKVIAGQSILSEAYLYLIT